MNLEKRNSFTNDILIIDGLWGTGKSLLTPIISGMSGVEKVRIDSVYEYVFSLFQLGKIEKDAAIWMLRTYVDMSQYHNIIGREVNLRWRDESGLKFAPNKLKLIKRLFSSEGDHKAEEISTKNIGLCVMSHMLMLTPDLLSPTFGKRVKVVEMVRHPLYMVEHFKAYLSRFDSPREFTMSFYHRGVKVPWFAKDWQDQFVNSSLIERAVLCILRLYMTLFDQIDISRSRGLAVLDISFEQLVFDPSLALSSLEAFIGRSHHQCIKSILKKQKIPRETIARGRGHRTYGWVKSSNSEEDSFRQLFEAVNSCQDKKLLQEFKDLICLYNIRYPSKIAQFQDMN
jgi:hypothetical protein